jgi:hypothetical protein
LRLGVAHALTEEIGVAPEVLGRRKRDRIDPILDRAVAGGREPGDPMSERSDELAELVGGQRLESTPIPGTAGERTSEG